MKSDNPEKKGKLSFKDTLKNPFNPVSLRLYYFLFAFVWWKCNIIYYLKFRSKEKINSKKNYPTKFKMDSVRPTAREIIPITVMDDRNSGNKSSRKHRKGSEEY